jgi:hypothetical protein
LLKVGRSGNWPLRGCDVASSNLLRHACRFLQSCADDFGGHGFAEEMTLSFVTSVGFDLPHLLFCLDALSDHGLVEARAKTGDRSDNRLGVSLFAQALDERLVYLDLLEGNLRR